MNREKYFKNPNSPFLLNTCNEGDGLELLRDLKDEVAQLVIFDPQYQVYNGLTWDPSGKRGSNSNWGQQSDRETITYPTITNDYWNITEFLTGFIRILKKNGFIIIWISEKILLAKDFMAWIPFQLKLKELF